MAKMKAYDNPKNPCELEKTLARYHKRVKELEAYHARKAWANTVSLDEGVLRTPVDIGRNAPSREPTRPYNAIRRLRRKIPTTRKKLRKFPAALAKYGDNIEKIIERLHISRATYFRYRAQIKAISETRS